MKSEVYSSEKASRSFSKKTSRTPWAPEVVHILALNRGRSITMRARERRPRVAALDFRGVLTENAFQQQGAQSAQAPRPNARRRLQAGGRLANAS
jgi:hypothetical protein